MINAYVPTLQLYQIATLRLFFSFSLCLKKAFGLDKAPTFTPDSSLGSWGRALWGEGEDPEPAGRRSALVLP